LFGHLDHFPIARYPVGADLQFWDLPKRSALLSLGDTA
jgi:hypothetical protein